MLAGILADTHENMPLIRKAVDFFNEKGVSLVLHGGDIISPICAREFRRLSAKMIAVFGNNDGEKKMWLEAVKPFGEIHKPPYAFEYEGFRFLLMHDPLNIEEFAASGEYDIIIYAHPHKSEIKQ